MATKNPTIHGLTEDKRIVTRKGTAAPLVEPKIQAGQTEEAAIGSTITESQKNLSTEPGVVLTKDISGVTTETREDPTAPRRSGFVNQKAFENALARHQGRPEPHVLGLAGAEPEPISRPIAEDVSSSQGQTAESIREQSRLQVQAQIDALNQQFDAELGRLNEEGRRRKERSRGIQASRGAAGTQFQERATQDVEEVNARQRRALEAERAARTAEIEGRAKQRAIEEARFERQQSFLEAEALIDRKKEMRDDARVDFISMAKGGAKFDEIPESTRQALLGQAGYDDFTARSIYNANLPKELQGDVDIRVVDGRMVRTVFNKDTGQFDIVRSEPLGDALPVDTTVPFKELTIGNTVYIVPEQLDPSLSLAEQAIGSFDITGEEGSVELKTIGTKETGYYSFNPLTGDKELLIAPVGRKGGGGSSSGKKAKKFTDAFESWYFDTFGKFPSVSSQEAQEEFERYQSTGGSTGLKQRSKRKEEAESAEQNPGGYTKGQLNKLRSVNIDPKNVVEADKYLNPDKREESTSDIWDFLK